MADPDMVEQSEKHEKEERFVTICIEDQKQKYISPGNDV